jgi:TPP-dependent pyruvate/acetoin dehydrogenase alpha subunit
MWAIFSVRTIAKEEEEHWKTQRDPLKLFIAWLLAEEMADDTVLQQIEQRVRDEVKAGEQFALDAPYPDAGEVAKDVYA